MSAIYTATPAPRTATSNARHRQTRPANQPATMTPTHHATHQTTPQRMLPPSEHRPPLPCADRDNHSLWAAAPSQHRARRHIAPDAQVAVPRIACIMPNTHPTHRATAQHRHHIDNVRAGHRHHAARTAPPKLRTVTDTGPPTSDRANVLFAVIVVAVTIGVIALSLLLQ